MVALPQSLMSYVCRLGKITKGLTSNSSLTRSYDRSDCLEKKPVFRTDDGFKNTGSTNANRERGIQDERRGQNGRQTNEQAESKMSEQKTLP